MFKKTGWLMAGMLACLPMFSQAEPIAFEQAANVCGLTGIEVGADLDYAYEKIEQQGAAAVENTVTDIPIFVRIGLPVMEIKVSAPYGNVKDNVSSTQNINFSGIRNVGLGLKTGLLALPSFALAVGLQTTFPTAEPEKYIFGEGLDLYPFAAMDLDIMIMKLHAQLGYEYRGEYNQTYNPITDQQYADAVKLKPGDATHWALGAEIPTGSPFFLMAELLGVKYGTVTLDGNSLPDSAGSTLEFVPGIRLEQGPFKAKVGYAIPLEKQSDRPSYAPRADWRILAGISLLFGM